MDPRDFNIHNIQERVDELGDLWRDVLGPAVDMEATLQRLEQMWQGQKA